MKVVKHNITLPEWLAVYLMTGDASSLTEEEYESAISFEEEVVAEYGSGHWADIERNGFNWHNDFDQSGGTVWHMHYVVIR